MVLSPFVAALLIGAVHFFGERIDEYTGRFNIFFVSFSAGVTLAYFFTALIPETIKYNTFGIENFTPLVGLSIFYALEEVVYHADKNFGEIKYHFKEIHTALVGLYHVAIAMILPFLYESSVQQYYLFLIPVLIHTAVNSLAMKEMHEEMLESIPLQVLISLSTVMGVLVAASLNISHSFSYSLLGVLGGSFMYIVIHDSLNPHTQRPLGFVAGMTLFLLIFVLA